VGKRGDDWDFYRSKLEAYDKFCAELGEEPAIVALAWLLANPVVTAPIIGPRTISQLDQSLHTLDVAFNFRELKATGCYLSWSRRCRPGSICVVNSSGQVL
jgi:aryl-alcohol dehydrogenase-like predicted oxidoreductase